MPDPNYVSEIEREDGTLLTIKDAEARAVIDGMNPTLQQILQGVNDIKNGIGDTKSIIDAILSGEALVPQVRFLDYDGAVVKTYTAEEFATLTKLPDNPTHTGLTPQGWNWSLADAKTYVASYGKLNIGQMYVTSDGKTRLYFTVTKNNLSVDLYLNLVSDTELDIDWGDGSEHTTWSSNDGDSSKSHEYASAGRYVIAVTTVTGGFTLSTALSNIYKIEIGNDVTSIGGSAFSDCSTLSSITIPDGVTSIGSGAFQSCYSLSGITIPDSVTSIDGGAFADCYSLSSITIPDSVTSIDGGAFFECYSLSSITIPNSVTSISDNAFTNCYSLSSIVIPDSVTSIGDSAFSDCRSLSSITIPDSVTSIGGSAFADCRSLSSITFESSTPPSLDSDIGIPNICIIRVPQGSLSTYTSAENYPDPSDYIYEEY